MANGGKAMGEVNSYTLVHTGAGGDGKRWRCGPGGAAGSGFPQGEQGYDCGEYEVHENQTLQACKALADSRPWCIGFVFKHTDSYGVEPEFKMGTCYLVSRLVVGGTRVPNLDSYLKESTPCLQRIKDSFRRWDNTESGLITKEELQNVMTSVWPDASDKDLQKLLQFADKSADGKIRYAEFIEWLWGGCSESLPGSSSKQSSKAPPEKTASSMKISRGGTELEISLAESFLGSLQDLEDALKERRDPVRLRLAMQEAKKAFDSKFQESMAALDEIAVLEAPLSRAESAGDAALLRSEIDVAKTALVRSSRITTAEQTLEKIEACLKPIGAQGEQITGVQAAMEWASSQLLRAQVNASKSGAGSGTAADQEKFQKCRQALAFYRLKAIIGGADSVDVICSALRVCQAVGIPESDLEKANRCVATLRAVHSTEDQIEEACQSAALLQPDFVSMLEWIQFICEKATS